jgi:hypothetical protein
MKNIFLLSLLSLTISCSQKQKEHQNPNDNDSAYKGFSAVKHNASITDLQGIWNVNELILSDETREYLLFSPDPDEYSYGNHIKLNPDQTFECFTRLIVEMAVLRALLVSTKLLTKITFVFI